MKKVRLLMVILFILFLFVYPAERMVELPDLLNPDGIRVGKSRIYIVEGTSVHIYARSDIKPLTTFGREGEGPGEFMAGRRFGGGIQIFPRADFLWIHNRGRMMRFSFDGKFIESLRASSTRGTYFIPIKDGFLGRSFTGRQNRSPMQSVSIYDNTLAPVKTIYQEEMSFFRGNGSFNVFARTLRLFAGQETIFLLEGDDPVIKVFDYRGNPRPDIRIENERIPVSDQTRKNILKFYRTDPRYKSFWDRIKDRIEIPAAYPAIRDIIVDGQVLYIQTFKRNNGQSIFIRFDTGSNRRTTVSAPFRMLNPMEPCPFDIRDNRLFQLVENIDDEIWELHISALK